MNLPGQESSNYAVYYSKWLSFLLNSSQVHGRTYRAHGGIVGWLGSAWDWRGDGLVVDILVVTYFNNYSELLSFNCSCVKCENNKTCNAFSEKCECPTGFTGSQCEDDIDECFSNPCDTNATCENYKGSYNCTCNYGFTGNGTNCTDIDECISSPCHTNATCNNTIGSYNCKCKEGFSGEGTSCTDINECSSNPCGDHEDCEDGIGSYTCKCEEGYLNDGTTCQGDKRLNAFVYKKNITQSIEECKNLCVEDDCCRSINYGKDPPSGEENICELFHIVKERSWELENKPGYEHYKLNYPNRQNIPTACYDWCKNDGKCGVQSKKCSCPDPGPQENPQCNEGSLNSSIILEGNCTYLSKLYEWLGNKTKWCLCYGAVEDQWNATDFHSKCDNHQHTVTIVRYGRNNILGGYSDVAWGGRSFVSSSNAFLFFLRSHYSSTFFKSPLNTSSSEPTIRRIPRYGPIFGVKNMTKDLLISRVRCNSYIKLGKAYQLPSGGSYNKYHFCLSIIEVFYEC